MQTCHVYEMFTQLMLLVLILRTKHAKSFSRCSQICATRENEVTSAAVLKTYVQIFLNIRH